MLQRDTLATLAKGNVPPSSLEKLLCDIYICIEGKECKEGKERGQSDDLLPITKPTGTPGTYVPEVAAVDCSFSTALVQ